MWVQVFQLALPRQDEILSPQEIPASDPPLVPSQCFSIVGTSFPMWVRVFNLHFFDKMKSCRHKRYRHLILDWFLASAFQLWVQVFPCGCEFSTCTSPTRWKSCRHKRYRHLILSWFRTGGSDLMGRRRGIQRQGETNRQKSLWLENAARPRNHPVSHPTQAKIEPQILLRRLFQKAVSANGKKGTKTAKAELAGCG